MNDVKIAARTPRNAKVQEKVELRRFDIPEPQIEVFYKKLDKVRNGNAANFALWKGLQKLFPGVNMGKEEVRIDVKNIFHPAIVVVGFPPEPEKKERKPRAAKPKAVPAPEPEPIKTRKPIGNKAVFE